MIFTTKRDRDVAEWTEARHLRGIVDDLEPLIEKVEVTKGFILDKDSGRPGHYWGRDIMIEGQLPAAAFHLAALEFGGDPDWYQDDAKFQAYMKRHPEYSYFNGG
jgi:hypothetical protein